MAEVIDGMRVEEVNTSHLASLLAPLFHSLTVRHRRRLTWMVHPRAKAGSNGTAFGHVMHHPG